MNNFAHPEAYFGWAARRDSRRCTHEPAINEVNKEQTQSMSCPISGSRRPRSEMTNRMGPHQGGMCCRTSVEIGDEP